MELKKQLTDLILCLKDLEFENFCKHYKIYEGTILLEDCRKIMIEDFLTELDATSLKRILSTLPIIMLQTKINKTMKTNFKMKEEEEIEYTCCGIEVTQEIKDIGLCPKCLEHI